MTSVVVTGLLMLVGLVGIVVPFLPGLLLVWLATALWAFEHPNRWAWAVFALCGVVYAVGVVTQYLVPGRRLKDAGVKTSTLFLAVLLAIVLFFLIPVVGAPIGFVLGVFLVETGRHRESGSAWRSTLHALKAVAMSIGIELVAGFLIVLIWLLGVWRLGIPT
ncbi:MAG TPA: DUF456 domain-containing protein [Lapillicoccus sp.]|jgi:uncharacterized protein YqgC (DUF456 family)|nr:DUF456 domain-containing protein [Lapillicoccus sp.]